MQRTEKAELIDSLRATLGSMSLMVVVHQSGMTVAEMTTLRRRMREAGAGFKVTKNRLAMRAIDGTPFAVASPLFKGPSAIAYSADPVAAAKVVAQYAKENQKLSIVGAALGDQLLNPEGVNALATLPSLDALRAKILGLIQAPATKVAGVLQAPAGQLARVFSAYGNKDESAAA